MTALFDTNVLVYRHDARFPVKQAAAWMLIHEHARAGDGWIAHQAVIEFYAAVSRPQKPDGLPLLAPLDARRETEELLAQFPVLYPTDAQVRLAVRGVATYGLSWFDAHMWAYAEHAGISTLYSEDFPHDRRYGTVRVINPFRTPPEPTTGSTAS